MLISTFSTLLPQMILLYAMILLGFLFGYFGKLRVFDITKLLHYIVTPMVIFYGTYNIPLSWNLILIPLIIVVLQSFMEWAIRVFLRDSLTYQKIFLISFMGGAKNCGYFGVPIAMLLFDQEIVYMYILTILGKVLQEFIYSKFLVKSKRRRVVAFRKTINSMFKLPILYAGMIGLILNFSNIFIPAIVIDFSNHMVYVYSILGMLSVGISLIPIQENIKNENFTYISKFDPIVILIPNFVHYIIWPSLMFTIIFLDRHYFGTLNVDIYNVLLLFSIMPMAANTSILASIFYIGSSAISFAVFVSITIALFYIPFMVYWLGII